MLSARPFQNDECNYRDIPQPRSLSDEITAHAAALAKRAHHIAEQADSRLNPVINDGLPKACGATAEGERVYPPLFHTLRSSFKDIEQALDRIESTLSRVEL